MLLLQHDLFPRFATTLGALAVALLCLLLPSPSLEERTALHDPVHSFLESVETSVMHRKRVLSSHGFFLRPPALRLARRR